MGHSRGDEKKRVLSRLSRWGRRTTHLLRYTSSAFLHLIVELDNAVLQTDGPLPNSKKCRNRSDKVLFAVQEWGEAVSTSVPSR
jgi:hypothetical protein